MPKHILIVVSCFNRPDLTGLTLDQIERQKSSVSDVLVLDDASTEMDMNFFTRWPFEVFQFAEHQGVGKMARKRLELFLNQTQKFLLALDNDVLLAKNFDLKCLNYWLEARAEYCGLNLENAVLNIRRKILVSGYRSVEHAPIASVNPNLIHVKAVGGICHFMSRDDAEYALEKMDETDGWHERMWDHNFPRLFDACVVPKRSLVEHTGRHGSGHNGYSEDMAIDFEGYQ